MKKDLQNLKIFGLIPARIASTRLPGKPLINICGKPLLQWVWEGACKSEYLQRIIIATDDEEIASLCDDIGAEYVMTPSDLNSGTDRIAMACEILNENPDIIINIQGDEPLIKGELIDKLVSRFYYSKADVGTIIKKITNFENLINPSVVKAIIDKNHLATNFLRMIDTPSNISNELIKNVGDNWQHIGIYAYSNKSLEEFVKLPKSGREITDRLEQMRLLENGATYFCLETELDLIGVDTPDDVEKVSKFLQNTNSMSVSIIQ